MESRRELLHAGCTAALAVSIAGCPGRGSAETRIGDIEVGNRQDRPNTIHLIVLCDGDVVLWKTYEFEAAPEDPNTASPGVVLDDIPAEWTNCRVHARLNDEEMEGIDLGEHGMECTYLKVNAMPADMGGGLEIAYSTLCE